MSSWRAKEAVDSEMILTDGFITVRAIETEPLPQTKLQILGPVTTHLGLLVISPNQVRVLGGGEDGIVCNPAGAWELGEEEVLEEEENRS